MPALPSRRLPGVRFEVPPPALDETLPRMDIAFFVGFATRGPLAQAVAVESLAGFEAVYGSGIALARDAATGEWVKGLLHPCVRSFFSQGGRRCWILRVAGPAVATSSFPVPGLLLAQRSAPGRPWRLAPARLLAGSAGSGADTLRLAARLDTQVLRLAPLSLAGDTLTVSTPAASLGDLQAGDLLRLPLADAQVHGRVARIEVQGTVARVVVQGLQALRALAADSPAPVLEALDIAEAEVASPPQAPQCAWGSDGLLSVHCRLAAPPQSGELVRLDFAGIGEAWMALAGVDIVEAAAPGALPEFVLRGRPWSALDPHASLEDWLADGVVLLARRLRAVLQVRDGATDAVQSAPLALATQAGAAQGLFGLADALAFPLVAPPAAGESLAVPLLALDDFGEGLVPVTGGAPALERDGLADFSWSLFAEPSLAWDCSDVLAERAEALRHAGRVPRPLHGMHALFGGAGDGLVDEPTLLAIPDALHPGWSPVVPPEAWTEFEAPPAPPPDQGGEPFIACDAAPLPAPRFVRGADPDAGGNFTLYWTDVAADAIYTLEEDTDPAFGTATPLYEGQATRFALLARPAGRFCYRVRATLAPRRSGWSRAVQVAIGVSAYQTAGWHSDQLLAIHRLMLRCAAARGDVVAVLALPEHFDAAAAAAHADALRYTSAVHDASLPPAIGADEGRALSHGALYHPWPVIRRVDAVIRFAPDGAACGQLASTALQRGAWIAVANRPLRDVVALTPPALAPTRAERQRLLDAQVNLLRSAPHGFVLSTADTLSTDSPWRPLNVRRLMCLLRRLVLRHGADYVFEPNGPTLRRTVERGFEALLDLLFRLGAFAGARAADAYRVDAGEELNPPRRSDLGQFWVELKVAPALPLSFLTVRLARLGERVVSRELH